jgi:hypothetical protein
MLNQAEQAAKKIDDANRGGDPEQQAIIWDSVQQNARPVDGFGIRADEFGDGSLLVGRALPFPNRDALIEWLNATTFARVLAHGSGVD